MRDERLYGYLRDQEPPARLVANIAAAPLVDEETIPVGRSYTSLGGLLTFRELDALRYASHGLTTPMTADALGLSLDTVAHHREGARLKLKAKTTCHAVALAIRAGLIA